jgi:hypothetical protein
MIGLCRFPGSKWQFQKEKANSNNNNNKNLACCLNKKCSPDGLKVFGEKKDGFKLNYYYLFFYKEFIYGKSYAVNVMRFGVIIIFK